MDAPSDVLWRVNNEYRKRLTQARTFVDLLEQMLRSEGSEHPSQVLATLDYIRDQVDGLIEDHRDWRYRFYYDTPESKRMVQTDRAIHQALARFSRMRTQHETRLIDLYNILYETPRPDPHATHVPKGDLWVMTQFAIHDLLGFSDYYQTLERTN